ncbi:SDR family oxidoreductase [Paraburkholderia phosphatilytica]|uniref:SDR family oxidoreductase n=1 Tax=Paraburkholderia phosphatilytica TaxID=2282883 RepID=UPI000E4A770B|nr:SDR family oxidoreductase [Paraburkholderia phosphatilytica]
MAHTSTHSPSPGARDLSGVRVAITGGTSGLGLALVDALRERGAKVAFIARTAARVAQVSATRADVAGIVGDIADKDAIYPLALQIAGLLGGLDVLINNASSLGPVPLAPLADTASEDLEATLATNLVGPFRLTKALLGSLASSARERGGALVVNVTSDAAVEPYPDWGAYGASKAALRHLTRIWDAELARERIRLRSFDPGDMDTPLHALAIPDADRSTLRQPADAARECVDLIADELLMLRDGFAAETIAESTALAAATHGDR